jgi:hypothetical protein
MEITDKTIGAKITVDMNAVKIVDRLLEVVRNRKGFDSDERVQTLLSESDKLLQELHERLSEIQAIHCADMHRRGVYIEGC